MHNNIYLISLTVKRESERTLISRSSISLFIVSGTPMRLLIRFLSIISEFPLFVYCLFSFIYAFGLLTHCYLFVNISLKILIFLSLFVSFFCFTVQCNFLSSSVYLSFSTSNSYFIFHYRLHDYFPKPLTYYFVAYSILQTNKKKLFHQFFIILTFWLIDF